MINQETKRRPRDLSEICEEVDNCDTREQKIKMMRAYAMSQSSYLDWVRCVFDPAIQFALPEGRPPFTPAGPTSATSWNKVHMQLSYFIKGMQAEKLNDLKREMKWIGLLEVLPEKDAIIVADMTDKKHKTTLDRELVDEAWPGLIK